MNNAKKKYKQKVTRKYVEIYPNDRILQDVLTRLRRNGIPFGTYVKALLIADELTRRGE